VRTHLHVREYMRDYTAEQRAVIDEWLRSCGGEPKRTRAVTLEGEGTIIAHELELPLRRERGEIVSHPVRYAAPAPPPWIRWSRP